MLPDGTLVYATRDARDEIYTTDIDPATGAFVGDLRPLSRRPVTARRSATWSPDGKQYAYLAVVNAIVDPQPVLAVGQVDSGEERIIPITGPQVPPVNGITWVGDSLYLNRVFSIERVVVETGARTTLASFPPDRMEIGVISPAPGASDLLVLFVEPGTTGSRRVGLLRVDTLTGRSTEIASRVGRVMALSPDGSTLAVRAVVQDASEILIRPVHGGEWKQVAGLPQPPPAAAPATANGSGGDFRWTPDGKALLIVREEPGADSSQAVLLRVPLDGGPVQKLAEPARLNRMDRIQLHPNGRQAMFHTFTYRYELWSVKNYLPGAASR
jgi:Tol biopolymer transport system component